MLNAQEEKRVIAAYMVRNITALCTFSAQIEDPETCAE